MKSVTFADDDLELVHEVSAVEVDPQTKLEVDPQAKLEMPEPRLEPRPEPIAQAGQDGPGISPEMAQQRVSRDKTALGPLRQAAPGPRLYHPGLRPTSPVKRSGSPERRQLIQDLERETRRKTEPALAPVAPAAPADISAALAAQTKTLELVLQAQGRMEAELAALRAAVERMQQTKR